MAGAAQRKGLSADDAKEKQPKMPGIRKAAILLMAVGEELATNLFQSLNESDVQRVADEIARMGEVSEEDLGQVMGEFHELVRSQAYLVRGGHEYAAKLLTGAFGPARADELLSQGNSARERTTGDLAMLQKMEPQQLSKFLENEHPQTVASGAGTPGFEARVGGADASGLGDAGRGDTEAGGDEAVLAGDGAEGGAGAASQDGLAGLDGQKELCGI